MKLIFAFIIFFGFIMEKSNSEQLLHSTPSIVLSIDGSAMKALYIACDQFLSTGRDLRKFQITISETIKNSKNNINADDTYVVTFMGKMAPGRRGLGTANRVPGSVTYFISKEKWVITKEQGVK